MTSGRGDEHFAALRTHVKTQPGTRVVRQLGERVRAVARQKAAT
ncbi:hypothetical protein ACFYYS_18075 [Streptomyces sp. NPDC002120]